MTVRRNSQPRGKRYFRKGYQPKVHKIGREYTNGYMTLCNIAGLMENHEEGTFLRTPADHRYACTTNDLEVTCVKCVRIRIGAKPTPPVHIRKADAKLGLFSK